MQSGKILTFKEIKKLGLILSLEEAWELIQRYWCLMTQSVASNSDELIESLRKEDELSAEVLEYLYQEWLDEKVNEKNVRMEFENHYVKLVRSLKFKKKKDLEV